MFENPVAANEAREIYRINNLLRPYRINFYYSLRKDCIFLFEGRSVKYRIITAYTMAAIGSILFLTLLFFPSISASPSAKWIIYPVASICCVAGIYILWDFYLKIKYNKTKIMISRIGISFREGKVFELWTKDKIKNMEVVQLLPRKSTEKAGFSEDDLKRNAKILVFNQLGKNRTLLEITNSNVLIRKNDLEEVVDFIPKFFKTENKPSFEKNTITLKKTEANTATI